MHIFQRIPILTMITAQLMLHTVVSAQAPIAADATLDARQQSIVTISVFTANGDRAALRGAFDTGLDAGLTVNEIKEVVVQLYAYAGFPRSLNALNTFMEVLDERKKAGKVDEMGREPDPLPDDKPRLEYGTELQTQLVGRPVSGPVYTFAPVIDKFLKEHLFCDIFGRNNLDFKTREIATIAALASLGGVDAQLRSHMNVGMHNGLSAAQLKELVAVVRTHVGQDEGRAAQAVLNTVLNEDPSADHTPVVDEVNLEHITVPFAKGELVTNGHFTGSVWLNMLTGADAGNDTQTGHVTFAPGARSHWHMHPGGQILLVTSGVGYVQERGQPKRILRAGESVACPPGVVHWHGAGPDSAFSHIAISTELHKGPVVWMEPVSDEQYGK